MRFFLVAAALSISSAGQAQETIVRVQNFDRAIADYAAPAVRHSAERTMADTTVARLWGLPVDTPIEEVLIGAGATKVRLVKLTAARPAVPIAQIAVTDIASQRERLLDRLVSDLQIVRRPTEGTTRAMIVAEGNSRLELFERGAKPMTERELKDFTAKGQFSTWTRFNNKPTGTVVWRPDGGAHVKWNQGSLDEAGTWTIRGDAVCTAWFRLREGKELCVQHYRLFGDTTQSFRADGTPDGIHTWKPAGILE